ncbi:hypothetical protein PHYBLDRAFT_164142 [Phycomyces blakesleeanus NRRL 1555(-)]|uniref:Uncharacterized protein n=1 Tax=Phycomyces blakesleeanus (strain ATCC 8743b / DSM 1359 / FGSC 10004 / NBRC 33097 / NRRL 1555) TaxID=763407 RepID=A0A163EK91_PHYB8|nr:hypothetical protein PHYBLDRAFT_164142 [Phycomyces blakesleeanus NRRL 1555(-)]OAD79060.1 hypothetical protein PHYBLDRAFT_164142 [Phycomyces blakesleeanus NRRL 1555(-)]|eukprot:XP_018297100.1 hypothetical protein PHYBLDRAFT_164142 [Phycomyces blakesleeanus NRRL 1555(-)]
MGLQPDFVSPTVKFEGGFIMVWGCFFCKSVGDLNVFKNVKGRFKCIFLHMKSIYISVEMRKLKNIETLFSFHCSQVEQQHHLPDLVWPTETGCQSTLALFKSAPCAWSF